MLHQHFHFSSVQIYNKAELKIRLSVEKTVCSGFWVQKHASFSPARKKMLGFRLRSPLPFVEEPCPLRLQTVFSTHKPSQDRVMISLGQRLRVFDILSLIYFPSCYQGYGDALYMTPSLTFKRAYATFFLQAYERYKSYRWGQSSC
jgi:hypothetical protein